MRALAVGACLLLLLFSNDSSDLEAQDRRLELFMEPETTVQLPETKPVAPPPTKKRLAVAQFVDSPTHLYGAYSIRNQMLKFNMTLENDISFVAVMPKEYPTAHPEAWEVANEVFDSVQLVDKDYIYDKLEKGLWKATFNKLWLFNLTDYEKVITLDADILVRTSIRHWFDYPTPSATQPVGAITWNSGAMVIAPNATTFEEMMSFLPQARAINHKNYSHDNMNSWTSDQGFISAFFTREELPQPLHMKTLPIQASILNKQLLSNPYWIHHRMHIFETVHLTTMKPWHPDVAPSRPIPCQMMREWKESVQGIERDYPRLKPLPMETLKNCPEVEEEQSA